jgi:hypothetical protein
MQRTRCSLTIFAATLVAPLLWLAASSTDAIAQGAGLSDTLKQAAGVGVGTAADEAAAGATMGTAATKGGAAAVNSAVDAQQVPPAEHGVSDTLKQAAGVGVGTAADQAAAGATMGTAATKGGAAAVNSALGVPAPADAPPADE